MTVSLRDLLLQADKLISEQYQDELGISYVNHSQFQRWARCSLLFLQTHYPNHPQTKDFESLVKISDHYASECGEMASILLAFDAIKPSSISEISYKATLEQVFERFHIVARQLLRRPNEATFADPDNDPLSITNNTRVHIVSNEDISNILKQSGAYNEDNHGLIAGYDIY